MNSTGYKEISAWTDIHTARNQPVVNDTISLFCIATSSAQNTVDSRHIFFILLSGLTRLPCVGFLGIGQISTSPQSLTAMQWLGNLKRMPLWAPSIYLANNMTNLSSYSISQEVASAATLLLTYRTDRWCCIYGSLSGNQSLRSCNVTWDLIYLSSRISDSLSPNQRMNRSVGSPSTNLPIKPLSSNNFTWRMVYAQIHTKHLILSTDIVRLR